MIGGFFGIPASGREHTLNKFLQKHTLNDRKTIDESF